VLCVCRCFCRFLFQSQKICRFSAFYNAWCVNVSTRWACEVHSRENDTVTGSAFSSLDELQMPLVARQDLQPTWKNSPQQSSKFCSRTPTMGTRRSPCWWRKNRPVEGKVGRTRWKLAFVKVISSVSTQLKRRQWKRLGRTLRRNETCIPKQSLCWKPAGHRKRGRPKNTWRLNLEKK